LLRPPKGSPDTALLAVLAVFPENNSGRSPERGGNPGPLRFGRRKNSEIPAVLALYFAVFANRYKPLRTSVQLPETKLDMAALNEIISLK
jgi:hypothetical protein